MRLTEIASRHSRPQLPPKQDMQMEGGQGDFGHEHAREKRMEKEKETAMATHISMHIISAWRRV
jgi:isopentenyl phosphate kinase